MADRVKDGETKPAKGSFEDRLAQTFERVASTTERVGIPAATFAIGAIAVMVSSNQPKIWILPWLGTALILSALGTYIWLTSRSTIRVQLPPPPIPVELQEQLLWMREQVEQQNKWTRAALAEQLASRTAQTKPV
jgi:hypothetical protein